MNIVQTHNLCKKYGEEKANDNISINVKKCSIYGLIGHNGAGKTTLLRQISGVIRPTSGKIKWNDGGRKPVVGMTLPTDKIEKDLTVEKLLYNYGNLSTDITKERVDELINKLDMGSYRKKKVGSLSTGMKQRVVIALALIDEPELLILDEPTNGLDPMGVKEIRELILRINSENDTSIIISSHNLGELTKIATHYGIISHGHLVKEFDAKDIAQMSEEQKEMYFIRLLEENA